MEHTPSVKICAHQQPQSLVVALPNACSSFDNLPAELFEIILDTVPVKELIHFRAVCKQWKEIIEHLLSVKPITIVFYLTRENNRHQELPDYFFEGPLSLAQVLAVRAVNENQRNAIIKNAHATLVKLFPRVHRLFFRSSKFYFCQKATT